MSSSTGSKESDITLDEFPRANEDFVSNIDLKKYVNVFSEEREILEIDKVRITPAVTIFKDAFEGRKFIQRLVIQNCGKTTAFIRICPPTSYAMKINAMVRGQYLSPGLKIVRNITYTYMHGSVVPLSYLPIYINNEYLDYKIIVTISASKICTESDLLDFGIVDVSHSSVTRTLILKNDGTKTSHFAIDLGTNNLGLIVKPMKGLIQAKSKHSLSVEVAHTTEGVFVQEFWVKCETPFRIQVKINFIAPQLKIFNNNGTPEFTFLDFGRTYFGTQIRKLLVIKNASQSPKMFCVMAEIGQERVLLKDAVQKRADFKCFRISPLDGRLGPQKGGMLEIVFSPKKFPKSTDPEYHYDYAICFIRIIQVNYIDLQGIVFQEPTATETSVLLTEPVDTDTGSTSISLSFEDDDKYPSLENIQNMNQKDQTVQLSPVKRVCLHGDCETAKMNINPNSLNLINLQLNQKENRTLLLTNNSAYLPIFFCYKKVTNLEVEPKKGRLKPLEAIEISVVITPTKFGQSNLEIVFDLLFPNLPKENDEYIIVGRSSVPVVFDVPSVRKLPKSKFNMGITPQVTNEVGFMTDDVRFNSSVEKPKAAIVAKKTTADDSDLIAFPNDKPKGLRPWSNVNRCRTLFSGIPRTVDSSHLLVSERKTKTAVDTYYTNYARSEGKRLRKLHLKPKEVTSEYEISGKMMLESEPYKPCKEKKEPESLPSFIPLTPTQLYYIKVKPLHINLEKVAANSRSKELISISNNNNFAIRVFMKCRQSALTFIEGPRKTIKANETAHIKIEFHSTAIGHYNIPINIIINENHCLEIALLAEVVHTFLVLNVEEVEFCSTEENTKSIEITNPLNMSVKFHWEVPYSCFYVEPNFGCVEPKRSCCSVIFYKPDPTAPISTHFIMLTDNESNQTIKVSVLIKKPSVAFEKKEYFLGHIPLNTLIQKKFVLKNNGHETVSYIVQNPEPIKGVKFSPIRGIFHGKSKQIFIADINIKACISFNCIVKFEIQRIHTVIFELYGQVDYPDIIIKPDVLSFRKVIVNSFDRLAFLVENKSKSVSNVYFDFEDYPDFVISESREMPDPAIPAEGLLLQPEECKNLFLHFAPIDMASYSVYMPVILNGILGPPCSNILDSIDPHSYLSKIEQEYSDSNNAIPIELPKLLPIIKITGSVAGHLLDFSSFSFNFNFFPNTNYISFTEDTLEITNVSEILVEFCIRTDELTETFKIKILHGTKIEQYENSILCRLESKYKVIFKISFTPYDACNYNLHLPVYVRHYLEGSPFNYINIRGIYPEPTIEIDQSIIYLGPVPPKSKSEKYITLKMSFHNLNCYVTAESDDLDLYIIFPDGHKTNSEMTNSSMKIKIYFMAHVPRNCNSQVFIKCTCHARYEISVKALCDCSVVTTHSFLYTSCMRGISQIFPVILSKSMAGINSPQEKNSLDMQDDLITFSDTISTLTEVNLFENTANSNETCYPYFPDDDNQSDYAEYMKNTLFVLENWIYDQGFHRKQFFKIPEGISAYSVEESKDNQKQKIQKTKAEPKNKEFVLNYVKLLMNLGGESIKDVINQRPLPENHLEKIGCIYSMYSNVLNLLMNEDGILSHIHPEHLLEYNDYVDYMNYIYCQHIAPINDKIPPILNEKSFYLVSKQSWMDLILQTFKRFVLWRVRVPTRATSLKALSKSTSLVFSSRSLISSVTSKSTLHTLENSQFIKIFEHSLLPHQNIYSRPELMLLCWLEYHFDDQRQILWNGHQEIILPPRHVQHFDKDLTDSLILAAVTAAYCPYMNEIFQSFYLDPQTFEQYFYNASHLIEAWKKVHYSFTITPSEIVHPNMIQMLLLVTYLYEFLPTLFPNETIDMTVNHTQLGQKSITIENISNYPITYNIEIFGKEYRYFEVYPKILKIPPKREENIKIIFHARKLACINSTMVLCGDVQDNYYAKSMAFNLLGIPDVSYINATEVFSGPIYHVFPKTFEVRSPYPVSGIYDIETTNASPHHIDLLHPYSWKDLKQHKLPRRIYNKNTKVEVDDNGVGITTAVICPMVPITREFIAYFLNPEIGDFSLKVVLPVSTVRTEFETITAVWPRGISTDRCSCTKKRSALSLTVKCSRIINIDLPCKNHIMWACIEKMVFESMDELEKPFWQKYLGTTTGAHLMQYIFDSERHLASRDIQHIFNRTVTYKVITQNKPPPPASLPNTITINDVISDGFIKVPLHIDLSKQEDFFFDLISEDGKEYRFYKMCFIDK